jgi:hypothetical protein
MNHNTIITLIISKAHPGSQIPPEQLYYVNPAYIICMTRKDKMKEGMVARTFHIPIDIDDDLRMMAIKDHLRFSEMAILAFREHISRVKVGRK